MPKFGMVHQRRRVGRTIRLRSVAISSSYGGIGAVDRSRLSAGVLKLPTEACCLNHGKGAIDVTKAIKSCGFQEAVTFLERCRGAVGSQIAPQKPPAELRPVEASENPPYKGSYEKFFKPHPWLEARGLPSDTLAKYEVGYGVSKTDSGKRHGLPARRRDWSRNPRWFCRVSFDTLKPVFVKVKTSRP